MGHREKRVIRGRGDGDWQSHGEHDWEGVTGTSGAMGTGLGQGRGYGDWQDCGDRRWDGPWV